MPARVSVLMTVYNPGPFLRPALDSLFAQSFADFELIAIENGSTDGSKEFLRQVADPRLRLIDLDHNIGRTPALIRALAEARGDLVAVLDADDLALPERFERQVAFLDQHQAIALVTSAAEWFNDGDGTHGLIIPPCDHDGLVAAFAAAQNPVVHSAVMMRRQAVLDVGGYSAAFVYSQDLALYLALVRAGFKLAALPEVLARLRVHSGSMSASPEHSVIRCREALILFKLVRRLPGVTRAALRQAHHPLTDIMVDYGTALIPSGRRLAGYGWLLRAFLRDPWHAGSNGKFQDWVIRPIPGLLSLLRRFKPTLGLMRRSSGKE